jgi:hypothetical protein
MKLNIDKLYSYFSMFVVALTGTLSLVAYLMILIGAVGE